MSCFSVAVSFIFICVIVAGVWVLESSTRVFFKISYLFSSFLSIVPSSYLSYVGMPLPDSFCVWVSECMRWARAPNTVRQWNRTTMDSILSFHCIKPTANERTKHTKGKMLCYYNTWSAYTSAKQKKTKNVRVNEASSVANHSNT